MINFQPKMPLDVTRFELAKDDVNLYKFPLDFDRFDINELTLNDDMFDHYIRFFGSLEDYSVMLLMFRDFCRRHSGEGVWVLTRYSKRRDKYVIVGNSLYDKGEWFL